MDIDTDSLRIRTTQSIKGGNRYGKPTNIGTFCIKQLLSKDELTFIFSLFN